MAWCTKLKPGEEIVIGDKTVIRVARVGERLAEVEVRDIGDPPRLSVKKRLVRPDEQ